MKVLIISDIHGNYEALKTVTESESYDDIIFLGDAVDYGPQPAEVVDFISENVKHAAMGNHDHAVINDVDCKCAPAMHHLSEFSRNNISKKLLSKNDIGKMKKFREKIEIEMEGIPMYLTHASPNNNLYGYLFSTEAEMVTRDPELKDFKYIMVGHTHFPMMYRSRIINPGSCGQPRDGNWKPWYAVLDTRDESVRFTRFQYDYGKTVRELELLVDKDSVEFRELSKFYLPQ